MVHGVARVVGYFTINPLTPLGVCIFKYNLNIIDAICGQNDAPFGGKNNALNPLNPKNDQHQIFPHHISVL